MRKHIAKKLRELFDKQLKEACPSFRLVRGAEIPASDRLYECEIGNGVTGYLMLCLHTNDDRFTLDVAWSRKGRFPTHFLPMSPVDIPEFAIRRAEPADGEFRTRIGQLWPPHRDVWWKVSNEPGLGELSMEDAMDYVFKGEKQTPPDEKLIREQIENAIGRIKKYVIPYLEAAARE